MLLLAVPGHAYMYHTWGKKCLLDVPHCGVITHCFPESSIVEFSHFVGVHYTWKICLPPASPWQTGVTLCDPVFMWIRQRHTQTDSSVSCKANELTLPRVLQFQHFLKGLMSWLKYYPTWDSNANLGNVLMKPKSSLSKGQFTHCATLCIKR